MTDVLGQVQATVLDKNNQKLAGAKVAALSADGVVLVSSTDTDGAVSLNLVPGSYRLFGWIELDGAPYFDPDWLSQESGLSVSVEQNSKTSLNLQALE